VGDADGVVVVPRERARDVVTRAQDREATEAAILKRVAAGESTMRIYAFH
jgi:4-hydroxy-4-methyl-2-oxoglutarate aldolase